MRFRGACPLFALVLIAAGVGAPAVLAQQTVEQPVFRSSVDLVSITAVVRDRNGRVVRSLTSKDFEVIDGGQARPILDLQIDSMSPASVAFLVDGSGSMRGTGAEFSRRICEAVLRSLNAERDDAALMSFDTRLLTLREFTSEFERVRDGLDELDAFGATSVYDAIAGTAAMVADRSRKRRAVILITDGSDNASSYTPEEVAWVASTIDVPVYVFAVGDAASIEPVSAKGTVTANPLKELARATGGDFYAASSATHAQIGIGRLLDELRHQYLIAFEPSSLSGLRKLEVRARNSDHKVRSRKWYFAGASD